ncbi:MAG: phosphoribosylformylglycinamidine synthase subunit PurQ [Deltaproteobacteria bacterium]|nr:phosphoribosylformylglycinamidine synthase subunit PurQ [Deltaproteobacteria bacterium]
MSVRALVLTGNGTNCEREMAHACQLAGAEATIAHTAEVFAGRVRLADYDFLNLPGGFLDGDDLGSAKAGAVRFKFGTVAGRSDPGTAGEGDRHRFLEDLLRFVADGKLVLGVCNGFQLLVKLGLLPALDGRYGEQTASLTHNDSGRFEDRWCYLTASPDSPCVFTRGISRLYLPVRHGEGKFVPGNHDVLRRVEAEALASVRYAEADGEPTLRYPENPNGSIGAIAGLCDPTGRIFGLMPHPEAFVHRTQHPRWTREDLPEEGDGLALFRNAVEFLRRG